MYKLHSQDGNSTLSVTRAGADTLELTLGKQKCVVLTEDLAALIRSELPQDRAQQLFSEMETAQIKSGKARVQVVARQDIKKGDPIAFTIDIAKYLDSKGQATGIRIAPRSGLIF